MVNLLEILFDIMNFNCIIIHFQVFFSEKY